MVNSTHHDIVIAGFGGQGLMVAGQLLATAGMLEGKKVAWIPSYGPEMRGGTANCTVVICEEEVGSPIVSFPTAVIAMNGPSMDKYEPRVKAGGVLIVNNSLVERESARNDLIVVYVPANEIALRVGNDRLATMVALGVLRARTSVVTFDSLVAALDKVLPERRKHLKEINILALQAGEKFVH